MNKEIERLLNEYRYSIGRTAEKWDSNAKDVDKITKEFIDKILSLFEAKIDGCFDDIQNYLVGKLQINKGNYNATQDIISIIKNKLR